MAMGSRTRLARKLSKASRTSCWVTTSRAAGRPWEMPRRMACMPASRHKAASSAPEKPSVLAIRSSSPKARLVLSLAKWTRKMAARPSAVGTRYLDVVVEPPRAADGRIECLESVGGSNHDHSAAGLQTVEEHQEL